MVSGVLLAGNAEPHMDQGADGFASWKKGNGDRDLAATRHGARRRGRIWDGRRCKLTNSPSGDTPRSTLTPSSAPATTSRSGTTGRRPAVRRQFQRLLRRPGPRSPQLLHRFPYLPRRPRLTNWYAY